MDSNKVREDIVSPLLKVSTYKAFTLTGPKEAIVRKVYSNQQMYFVNLLLLNIIEVEKV